MLFLNKNRCFLKINLSKEDTNIDHFSMTSTIIDSEILLCKNKYNNNNNTNIFLESDFVTIFHVSKIVWFDLIKNEYQYQTKSNNLLKKKFRSRSR